MGNAETGDQRFTRQPWAVVRLQSVRTSDLTTPAGLGSLRVQIVRIRVLVLVATTRQIELGTIAGDLLGTDQLHEEEKILGEALLGFQQVLLYGETVAIGAVVAGSASRLAISRPPVGGGDVGEAGRPVGRADLPPFVGGVGGYGGSVLVRYLGIAHCRRYLL